MNFSSIIFYVFFLVVLLGYHGLKWKYGRVWMVIASYVFYSFANPWYILLLFTSTCTDFIAAQRIEDGTGNRSSWMWLSVIINLGLLGVFKYGDFIIGSFNQGLGVQIPYLNVLLPVGISFYTFQTMSYTIDVYRGNQKAERSFITFALFVGYFPQLVAGPIERAKQLIPQLSTKRKVTVQDFEYGMQRITLGLFKKLVIADRLGVYVSDVYNYPASMGKWGIVLSFYAFIWQIYFDFAAYSDIAIGLSRLFGVRLSENFNFPLQATSQQKAWSRWHMTLTRWFRDYLLGSLRSTYGKSEYKGYLYILIVLGVTGFWHGAEWTMLSFGVLGGVYIIIQKLLNKVVSFSSWYQSVIGRGILAFVNMSLFASLSIFFRSGDMNQAFHLLEPLTTSGNWGLNRLAYPFLGFFLLIYGLDAFAHWAYRKNVSLWPASRPFRWAGILALLVGALLLGVSDADSFIYFQF